MKQTISILILAAMLYSCGNNSQSKAISDAKQIQSELKKMQPGGIATSESGWTMTATINGKKWLANSLMPLEATGRIIGDNNGESISLPYDRRDMVVGEKTNFENSAVDLFLNNDVAIWGGHTGKMEITKVDDKWAEGKFFFTATSSSTDKKIEVTDGFFRISMAQKQ